MMCACHVPPSRLRATGRRNVHCVSLHPPPTMTDINAIAKQFTDFYYATFSQGRPSLKALYVRRCSIHRPLSALIRSSATTPCSPSRVPPSRASPTSPRSSRSVIHCSIAPLHRDNLSAEPPVHKGPAQNHDTGRATLLAVRRQPPGQRNRPPSRAPAVILPMIPHSSRRHQVDDNENPLNFSQVFHLIPEGGSYYVSVPIARSLPPAHAFLPDSTISSASTTVKRTPPRRSHM